MQIHVIRNENDLSEIKKQIDALNINDEYYLVLVDISKQNIDLELTFSLKKENSKLEFGLFCLNQDAWKKNFVIKVNHEVEKTYSYVKYHGIGMHDSNTRLTFLSRNNIKPLANIYSEQEIKEILMQNAKFSGIPQIDAANNSFTSAHKLMVGNVNKEELFYLTSLGINKIKSVSILIGTLYKSLLKGENDNLEEEIRKEIENGTIKKL